MAVSEGVTPDLSGEAPPSDQRAAHPPRRVAALVTMAALALGALGLDLLTKQLAINGLTGREPVRLLGGAVYLVLTRNSGAAFSLGNQHTYIFPIVTLGVVVGIMVLARRLASVPWAIAMGLILGGGLGNLMDRIFRAPGPFVGHVVDFISLFDDAGRVWPIFNVADSALFCGVICAIGLELAGRRRDGLRVVSERRDKS